MISLIVLTVKRNQSFKLELDLNVLHKSIHRKKYQTPNTEVLHDKVV